MSESINESIIQSAKLLTENGSLSVTNPYIGPGPYKRSQSNLFFGRERESRDLISLVIANRIVLFFAPSGAGKSSLINTQLVPKLEERGFEVLPVARVNGSPRLASTTANIFAFHLMTCLDQGDNDDERFAKLCLTDFLRNLVLINDLWIYWETINGDNSDNQEYRDKEKEATIGDEEDDFEISPRVLIIDQFEDILTSYPEAWEKRSDFFRQLNQAMHDDPYLWIIFAIREDYVAGLTPYAHLLPDNLRVRYQMQRMGVRAALDAVRKPAELFGRHFDVGVAEYLVDNLRQIRSSKFEGNADLLLGEFIEPVQLQIVCQSLWEDLKEHSGDTIDMTAIQQVADVDKSLAQFYQKTIDTVVQQSEIKVSEWQIREWLENKLITEAGTRSTVFRSEHETEGLPTSVVDILIANSLLDTELRAGGVWIELIHDRFVDPILNANAAWRPDYIAGLPQLYDEAIADILKQIPPGMTERGLRNWIDKHLLSSRSVQLGANETAGLPNKIIDLMIEKDIVCTIYNNGVTSIELANEFLVDPVQRANHAWWSDYLNKNPLAANFQRWNQEYRRDEYLLHGNALREAQNIVIKQPNEVTDEEKAYLKRSQERERKRNLRRFFLSLFVIVIIISLVGVAAVVWDARERAKVEAANAKQAQREAEIQKQKAEDQAILARSRELAALSTSELAQQHSESALLLAIESGLVHPSLEAFSAIRAVIFHPWSSSQILFGHTNSILQATWNYDESRILTRSADNTVRVWNPQSGSEVASFGHSHDVLEATWSQDKLRILTASADNTARIWDVKSGDESVSFIGHTGAVLEATWNQDESLVLTRSEDKTIRIWDAKTGKEIARLNGHEGLITQAMWSYDESRILTSSEDSTVRIWDATNGQELVRLTGHTAAVRQATWNRDGSRILTSSDDSTAHVWDAVSGQQLILLMGHTAAVRQAIWNQDESRILTSSDDSTVRVWDATNGQELLKLTGHRSWIQQALWNQAESLILTLSNEDNIVHIWDAGSGRERVQLKGHTGSIRQATWNQDGTQVLTISFDKTARIWDAREGNEIVRLDSHSSTILQAIWNQDESRILTSSADATARIWDAKSGNELVNIEMDNFIRQATWSGDESRILTYGDDNIVRIWDTEEVNQELVRFIGHTNTILHAAWNQNESRVLTNSKDGTARIWDVESAKQLVSFRGHTDAVLHAAWSQNESRILSSSADNTARIWDAESGKELVLFTGHTDAVLQATWSRDELRVLTSSEDGTARIWDAKSGNQHVLLEGHTAAVLQAIWSQDESRVLTRGADNTVRIWDAESGKLRALIDGHPAAVLQATWSRDELRVLTGSEDSTARIWSAESGEQLVLFKGHTAAVLQATWSQDELRVLTSSEDGTARIWDAQNGKELMPLLGHSDAVLEAIWSQDGSRVLTRSKDTTARIWNTESGEQLIRFEEHNDVIWQAIWSQNESRVLTRSGDNTVRVWYTQMDDLIEATCKQAPRNMTRTEWQRFMNGLYRPTCEQAPIPDEFEVRPSSTE